MARLSVKQVLERNAKAWGVATQWHSLYASIYELIAPNRNMFFIQTDGEKKTSKIFDSTGMSSVNTFVNNLQSMLVPPFRRWSEIVASDYVDEEVREGLNEQLSIITKVFFEIINNSNFNTAAPESFYDLSLGTSALLVLKGDADMPVNYLSIPISQLALETGKFGSVGGVYRKHNIQARLIKHEFVDAEITSSLSDIIEKDPTREVELVEACYYDYDSKLWYYDIIYEAEKERIVERQERTNPWIITFWSKIPGETWGRGVALQAAPDLKMLNHAKELGIKSAQLNAFGVYTVEDEGILNTQTLEIAPGSFISVASNGGSGRSPSIASLPRSGDVQLQEFLFQELKADIKQLMHDNKLPNDGGAVKSATEIAQRIKDLSQDYGAAFGRLQQDFVNKIWERTLDILETSGLIQFPETTEIIDGKEVRQRLDLQSFITKIKVLAPIAKAQNMEDVQNFIQWAQLLQTLDPTGASLLKGVNSDKSIPWLADKIGVPTELVNNADEMKAVQANIDAQQQMQMQQQQQGV